MEPNEISKAFKLLNPGTLDWFYGPYNSIYDANEAINISVRLHKTVGIIIDGEIVEHQYSSSLELKPKVDYSKLNGPIQEANEVIEEVKTATVNANTATLAANVAANTATFAANNADDKAGLADTAAGEAIQAAVVADDAAGRADVATGKANTAAGSADTAAFNANDKADKARIATSSTVTATNNAVTATNAANNAAAVANAARGWTPVTADEMFTPSGSDTARIIRKMVNYIGGTGTIPTANLNLYQKSDGTYTADKNLAMDYKGGVLFPSFQVDDNMDLIAFVPDGANYLFSLTSNSELILNI